MGFWEEATSNCVPSTHHRSIDGLFPSQNCSWIVSTVWGGEINWYYSLYSKQRHRLRSCQVGMQSPSWKICLLGLWQHNCVALHNQYDSEIERLSQTLDRIKGTVLLFYTTQSEMDYQNLKPEPIKILRASRLPGCACIGNTLGDKGGVSSL